MFEKLTNLFRDESKYEPVEDDNKEYLDNLFEGINLIKDNKVTVMANFLYLKRGGFVIKVRGLYGFIPLSLMGWKYSFEEWKLVSDSITGRKNGLPVKIISVEGNKIIAAFDQKFQPEDFTLKNEKFYKGIIIKKAAKFVIIDLGHSFGWKFGSLTYFIDLKKCGNIEEIALYEAGDSLTLQYLEEKECWLKTTLDKTQIAALNKQTDELQGMPFKGAYGTTVLEQHPEYSTKLGFWVNKDTFAFLDCKKKYYDVVLHPFIKQTLADLKEQDKIVFQYVTISSNYVRIKFISKV